MTRARLVHTVIRHTREPLLRPAGSGTGSEPESLVAARLVALRDRASALAMATSTDTSAGRPAAIRMAFDLADTSVFAFALQSRRERAKTLAVKCRWGPLCAMSAACEARGNDRPRARRHHDAAA